jgi:catechol 2,3-dioxygenase-like lactoylglutathione lyase family enzyme
MGFPGAALELAQVRGYGCMVEFIRYKAAGGSREKAGANCRSVGHIAFEVDDIYAITAELSKRGVEFVSGVIEHSFAPWVQFNDPDGIRLEFMELRN